MRLIVASTRDQQHNLKVQYPEDKVVVVGAALYGIQVTEIVDETFPNVARTEWEVRWWEHAQCRVKPQ